MYPRNHRDRRRDADAPHEGPALPGSGGTLSAEWERERLFAAVLDEVAAHGFAAVTPASTAARAGLTAAGFHAHFADVRECFVAAFENIARQIHARMIAAYRSCEGERCAAMHAALGVLAQALCARPEIARACLLDAPSDPKLGAAQLAVALPFLDDTLREMLDDLP